MKMSAAELAVALIGKREEPLCLHGLGLLDATIPPALWDLAASFLLCVCGRRASQWQSGSGLEEKTLEREGAGQGVNDTKCFHVV